MATQRKTISDKAVRRYRAFHGKQPMKLEKKNVKMPAELVFLAKPEYITYLSDKFNGGGVGKMEAFKHKFGPTTKMYTNPEGTMLVIMGRDMKVLKQGIVN